MNTKLKFLGFYMIVSIVSFFLSRYLQKHQLQNYQVVLLTTLTIILLVFLAKNSLKRILNLN